MASDVHQFVELLRVARSAPREQAIAAYEAALGLYAGDLLDRADMPDGWWWLYDGPEVAVNLRADYRLLHQEARRHLADLYAAGNHNDLRRAEQLYLGLAGESAEDEHLWAALFRTQAKLGDLVALDDSVRRLRSALVEMGEARDGPSGVLLPPGLSRLIDDLRVQLSRHAPTT